METNPLRKVATMLSKDDWATKEVASRKTTREMTEKAATILSNIADVAIKASVYLKEALDDPSLDPESRIRIAEYAINRILGKPAGNISVDQETRILSLKGDIGSVGQDYSKFVESRTVEVLDNSEIEENPELEVENPE